MKTLSFLFLLALPVMVIGQGNCSTTIYSGNGTYYTATTTGNCSFDTTENGLFYCAMNGPQYDTASYCGTCLEVAGSAGTQVVYVTDQCPSCNSGDLDLSPDAFQAIIGNLSLGTGSISWKEVSCPFSNPLWLSNLSSNPWFASFIIHNHVNEISSVEVNEFGTWINLVRNSGNLWQLGSLGGDTLVEARITDIYGQQILINNISMNNTSQLFYAASNFTPCTNLGIEEKNTDQIKILYLSDEIRIETSTVFSDLMIIDMSGRMIESKQLNHYQNNILIATNAYPNGIYHVILSDKDGNFSQITFAK